MCLAPNVNLMLHSYPWIEKNNMWPKFFHDLRVNINLVCTSGEYILANYIRSLDTIDREKLIHIRRLRMGIAWLKKHGR